MAGHHADPEGIRGEDHQDVFHARLVREILRVSREFELATLDGVLVDGGRDEHVHLGGCEVFDSGFEAEAGKFSRIRMRLAPIRLE